MNIKLQNQPPTPVALGTYKQCPFWKLRAKFRECGMFDNEVAQATGIANPTFTRRMQGKRPWLSSEIAAICQLLGIPQEQIGEYFFPDINKKEKLHEA